MDACAHPQPKVPPAIMLVACVFMLLAAMKAVLTKYVWGQPLAALRPNLTVHVHLHKLCACLGWSRQTVECGIIFKANAR